MIGPGRVVGGRYELLSKLGQGGMGVVYKSHDRVLGETVALKILRPDVAEPAMARRFREEIKLARSVTHRNVGRIHEYGVDGDLHFITMAYVDGVDLKTVLRQRGPLPREEALDLAVAVADGLHAIHQEGIVHRDLKTQNLMLDAHGVVRVMDFGIAKQLRTEAGESLTGTGAVVGTPDYMSPEQIRGERVDARSDVYALGVVVFELLTGSTPFRGDTPMATLLQHIEAPPPLSGPRAAAIPQDVKPVLGRALAKRPSERYASAAQMGDELRALRSGPGVPAEVGATRTVEVVEPRGPRSAPRSRRVALLAGLLGGTVAVAALAVIAARRPPAPTIAPSSPPEAASSTLGTPVRRPPEVVHPSTPPEPRIPGSLPKADPDEAGRKAPPAATRPREAPPALDPAAAEEVAALLEEAESALAARQYEAALAFYQEALRKDPSSERARGGHRVASAALERAARNPVGSFVASTTTHAPASPTSTSPRGFEATRALSVRPVEQAAPPPARIVFEAEPRTPAPGQPFSIHAFVLNEGAVPLSLAEASALNTRNGRSVDAPVALLVRQVPPRQKALVFSVSDSWRAETESWSLTVRVRTAEGDVSSNTLRWVPAEGEGR